MAGMGRPKPRAPIRTITNTVDRALGPPSETKKTETAPRPKKIVATPAPTATPASQPADTEKFSGLTIKCAPPDPSLFDYCVSANLGGAQLACAKPCVSMPNTRCAVARARAAAETANARQTSSPRGCRIEGWSPCPSFAARYGRMRHTAIRDADTHRRTRACARTRGWQWLCCFLFGRCGTAALATAWSRAWGVQARVALCATPVPALRWCRCTPLPTVMTAPLFIHPSCLCGLAAAQQLQKGKEDVGGEGDWVCLCAHLCVLGAFFNMGPTALRCAHGTLNKGLARLARTRLPTRTGAHARTHKSTHAQPNAQPNAHIETHARTARTRAQPAACSRSRSPPSPTLCLTRMCSWGAGHHRRPLTQNNDAVRRHTATPSDVVQWPRY